MKNKLPEQVPVSVMRSLSKRSQWLVDGWIVVELGTVPDSVVELVRSRALYEGVSDPRRAGERYAVLEHLMADRYAADAAMAAAKLKSADAEAIRALISGNSIDLPPIGSLLDRISDAGA